MSEVERKYIKSVDEEILKASGKKLKKLQQLDFKTQLHSNTFYDAYVTYHKASNKENIPSNTQISRKNKF